MVSPPNFSKSASANTNANIDSAIIEAAGTEHESVRSLCANFSSLDIISIDLEA